MIERGNFSSRHFAALPAMAIVPVCLCVAGCALSGPTGGRSTASAPVSSVTMNGRVQGGQQPVASSQVYLYAAATNGYGTASTSLLNPAAAGVATDYNGNGYVTTDAGGGFSITATYTCPAGALVYAVAIGGNPGLGVQANSGSLSMMAALGPCSNLTPSTNIVINELTTVASVWALAPFMADYTAIGTSPGNIAGLTNAFAAANEIVNISNGGLGGPTLPANTTLPIAQMNTIADILSACINTQGGIAGDGTLCSALFTAATPTGYPPPNDTIAAALNMAKNPALGISALFSLVQASPPFLPVLSGAPTDWTLAVQYAPAGLSTPKAIAIDGSSNVWIASCGSATCTTSGTGSVTQLNNLGAAIGTTSGGGLNIPYAIAIDLSGNAWVANFGGNSVTRLTTSLTPIGSAFTGGGLNQPNSIAIDSSGNAWLTNAGNATESEFSSSGVALSGSNGITVPGLTSPVAIAINPY